MILASLRTYSGGYHAKTYLGCNLILLVVISSVLAIITTYGHNMNIVLYGGILSNITSLIIVILYSPLENKNKILESEAKSRYRNLSIAIVIALIIGWSLIIGVNAVIAFSISTSLLFVAVSIVVGKLVEGRCNL